MTDDRTQAFMDHCSDEFATLSEQLGQGGTMTMGVEWGHRHWWQPTVRQVASVLLIVTIALGAYVIGHHTAHPTALGTGRGCDYSALSVQPDYQGPADQPYREWWIFDGTSYPIGTIDARTAAVALNTVRINWADSYGETCGP